MKAKRWNLFTRYLIYGHRKHDTNNTWIARSISFIVKTVLNQLRNPDTYTCIFSNKSYEYVSLQITYIVTYLISIIPTFYGTYPQVSSLTLNTWLSYVQRFIFYVRRNKTSNPTYYTPPEQYIIDKNILNYKNLIVL